MKRIITSLQLMTLALITNAQTSYPVTSFVTDMYNGTLSVDNQSRKVDTTANLIAFKYNNVFYTTGVNDTMAQRVIGGVIELAKWKAFQINNISLTDSSGVYIGRGEKLGNTNLPLDSIHRYTTDGEKGLDLSTGVYNIPKGNKLVYKIQKIDEVKISDSIPDILINQIGQINTGAQDKFYFVDSSGNIIGDTVTFQLGTITPSGIVSNYFFNAGDRLFNLPISTPPTRDIRFVGVELSQFGLNDTNSLRVDRFVHILSGVTDQAFIAYNESTFTPSSSLPISVHDFKGTTNVDINKLTWKITSAKDAKNVELQYSTNTRDYVTISIFDAKIGVYNFNHKVVERKNYYRLKLNDLNDTYKYSSNIVELESKLPNIITIYPNPTRDIVKFSREVDEVIVFSINSILIDRKSKVKSINLEEYPVGEYIIYADKETFKVIKY